MPSCGRSSVYFHTVEMDRDETSFIKTILDMNAENRRGILFPVATDEEIKNIDPPGAALLFKKLVEMERNGNATFTGRKIEIPRPKGRGFPGGHDKKGKKETIYLRKSM